MQEKCNYVRIKLTEHHLTQRWIKEELGKRGIKVDRSLLNHIINGNRSGNMPEKVIDTAITILNKYEQTYVNGA